MIARRAFRVAYTLTGLARLCGMSRQELRHLVRNMPAWQPRRVGRKRMYYLTDLRSIDPDLWESIRLKRELDSEDDDAMRDAQAFAKTAW